MRRASRLLLAAVAVLAGTPAGAAAQAPDPGFSVEAAGFESYFTFRSRPGATERARVRLRNHSRRAVTVLLHPADVTTAATGGLAYGDGTPAADGRWLRLDRDLVRVPAGASRVVGLRVRVPRDAAGGEHLAGVVAMNQRDVLAAERRGGEGLQLRFLPRLAVAVRTRLPGAAAGALVPGPATIERLPSGAVASLPVRLGGGRLVDGVRGKLMLKQGSKVLRHRVVELGSFVPGTAIALKVPFPKAPGDESYRLVGRLVADGGKPVAVDAAVETGPAPAAVPGAAEVPVPGGGIAPWVLSLLAAALAAGCVGAGLALRERERRAAGAVAA